MAQSFVKLKNMMAEMGADKSNAIQQLFSTHPDLEKRIEKMEEKLKKEGIAAPTAAN